MVQPLWKTIWWSLKKLNVELPFDPAIPFFFFFLIYFWLRWVFVAVCGLSLVAASRGYSSLRCTGFSLWWLLIVVASLVVEHGL